MVQGVWQLAAKPMTTAAAAPLMTGCRLCSALTTGKCWSCLPRIAPQTRSERRFAIMRSLGIGRCPFATSINVGVSHSSARLRPQAAALDLMPSDVRQGRSDTLIWRI